MKYFTVTLLWLHRMIWYDHCKRELKPHAHTHPLIDPLSGTTRVSRYRKGKTNLDFTEARDSEWQWHQLGHMQVCISLQTDNHASTPLLSFLQARCPSCRPTNSVKALQQTEYTTIHWGRHFIQPKWFCILHFVVFNCYRLFHIRRTSSLRVLYRFSIRRQDSAHTMRGRERRGNSSGHTHKMTWNAYTSCFKKAKEIRSWLPPFRKQNLLFIQRRWQLRRTYFFNDCSVLV